VRRRRNMVGENMLRKFQARGGGPCTRSAVVAACAGKMCAQLRSSEVKGDARGNGSCPAVHHSGVVAQRRHVESHVQRVRALFARRVYTPRVDIYTVVRPLSPGGVPTTRCYYDIMNGQYSVESCHTTQYVVRWIEWRRQRNRHNSGS